MSTLPQVFTIKNVGEKHFSNKTQCGPTFDKIVQYSSQNERRNHLPLSERNPKTHYPLI